MARVHEIELNEVPKDIQNIYREYSTNYGPFINQVKVFAQRPPALKHIMGMLLEMDKEALIPKRYLEISVIVVSRLNQCEYCVDHHTPRLLVEGFSQETVDRILEEDCPGLDELDQLVRDLAIQVTHTPANIPEKVFDGLRNHFTDPQIVELVLRISLCGFFNRFNDALQIENELKG